MTFIRKKDIQFGKKDLLSEDEFDPKNGKERITLFVDQQVVNAFRKKAENEGSKYQTLMRESLRSTVFPKDQDFEGRLKKIEEVVFNKKKQA